MRENRSICVHVKICFVTHVKLVNVVLDAHLLFSYSELLCHFWNLARESTLNETDALKVKACKHAVVAFEHFALILQCLTPVF